MATVVASVVYIITKLFTHNVMQPTMRIIFRNLLKLCSKTFYLLLNLLFFVSPKAFQKKTALEIDQQFL